MCIQLSRFLRESFLGRRFYIPQVVEHGKGQTVVGFEKKMKDFFERACEEEKCESKAQKKGKEMVSGAPG